MLEIFNRLAPFFEDSYRRINVREYARICKISPPSASKYLDLFHKEGLLNQEKEKNYIHYYANRENKVFIVISRIYWLEKLSAAGVIEYFERDNGYPLVIL